MSISRSLTLRAPRADTLAVKQLLWHPFPLSVTLHSAPSFPKITLQTVRVRASKRIKIGDNWFINPYALVHMSRAGGERAKKRPNDRYIVHAWDEPPINVGGRRES